MSNKKDTGKLSLKENEQEGILSERKKRQLIAVSFLFLSIFGGISLLSFYLTTYNIISKPILGPVGDMFAKTFAYPFGFGSLVVPFLLLVWGWNRLLDLPIRRLLLRTALVIGIVLALGTLMSIDFAKSEWWLGFEQGGVFGKLFATILKKLFSKVGAYFITTAMLFIITIITTDIDIAGWIVDLINKAGTPAINLQENSNTKQELSLFDKIINSYQHWKETHKPDTQDYKEPKSRYEKISKDKQPDVPWNKPLEEKSSEFLQDEKSDTKKQEITEKKQESENEVKSNGDTDKDTGFESQDGLITPIATQLSGEYKKPTIDMLDDVPPQNIDLEKEELKENSYTLENKLKDFGVEGKVIQVSPGPVVTRYELRPAPGVKISKIVGLADDLALVMKAKSIRIVAPIPGKDAVGIELPNKKSSIVYLKEILLSEAYQKSKSIFTLALGKGISGEPYCIDLKKMPHLLIAGATGSGKSVCISVIISSILFRATPEEVRFIMIDPKMVELAIYNGIPHLLSPVVTRPKEAIKALKWTVLEMERRYRLFAACGVRNIDDYNKRVLNKELRTGNLDLFDDVDPTKIMYHIVIIIDELADLMLTVGNEIEDLVARLAQMARAVGIHIVLATQRPSVDVVTGLIKANFPARIAFQVSSKVDSRTILDINGAEKLLGNGDMLYLPPGRPEPMRIHGAYISREETEKIVEFLGGGHINPLTLVPGFVSAEDKEKEKKKKSKDIEDEKIELIYAPSKKEQIHKSDETNQKGEHSNQKIKDTQNIKKSDVIKKSESPNTNVSSKEKTIFEVVDEKEANDNLTEYDVDDEMYRQAVDLVIRHQQGSISLIQRRLKVGYARAARLIDIMERNGIVGPYEGSKPREVLISQEDWEKMKHNLPKLE